MQHGNNTESAQCNSSILGDKQNGGTNKKFHHIPMGFSQATDPLDQMHNFPKMANARD